MPIKIPNALPATDTLRSENIFVMTETRAMTQDIRPLQIALVNLMPTKIDTETQLARVLGNTPLQIELELIAPSGHESKNTSESHMLAFYKTFDDVKDRTFDGLLITGVGQLQGGFADGCNDHRIVMAAAVAAATADRPVRILGAEAVEKSYPDFWKDLENLADERSRTCQVSGSESASD